MSLIYFILALTLLKESTSYRIVSGNNAATGQFPYMVSLRSSANLHFCGGTIISNRWILSAAHCTTGRTASAIKAVVGTNSLQTGGVTYNADTIVNHPSYNDQTVANDVSLVRTTTAIVFNELTKAISLGSAAVGVASGTASGWGQTSEPGSLSNVLQYFTADTMTNENCINAHNVDHRPMIFSHKMCSFSRNGQGICMGDSGGPFVIDNTVAGIISWIIPCGIGYPDVYDRVAYHRTWILGYIQ